MKISILFTQIIQITVITASQFILTPKQEILDNPLHTFETANEVAEEFNLKMLVNFKFGNNKWLNVYTSDFENMQIFKYELNAYYDIEENTRLTINNQFVLVHPAKNVVPWHLDRITKRKLPLDGTYKYGKSGDCFTNSNVEIDTYIIDTGIDISHPEFQGRATWEANFADKIDRDCNNHGTHVAGLVGSKTYGVCVDARMYAIKVLDCKGSGSLSGVIRGIEHVYKKHMVRKSNSSKIVKSVINMSLGGGVSSTLNKAIEMCIENDNDFYVVVASGNENQDACKTSPGSVKGIFTVMASDKSDKRAGFSNWGSCANIYSPGVDILSTIAGGGVAEYSGTSMASPVLAGVLLHYIDMYPENNLKTMINLIIKMSSPNTVRGNKPSTVRNLVYLQRN